MTLADILEQQRGLYLSAFLKRARSYNAQMTSVLRSEALYRTADGQSTRTGSLKLPARGDFCVRRIEEDGQPTNSSEAAFLDERLVEIARIESPRSLTFKGFRFVWGESLQVALYPFAWDDCALCIPEPMVAIDLPLLGVWLETELREELSHAACGELLNVVHSMSDPRQADDGVRFEIDFGSAGVSAFETLLAALADSGAGLVVIGRPNVQATQISL